MSDPVMTVADWLAEGETTMLLACLADGCGHSATLDLARLPPTLTRDAIVRRAASRGLVEDSEP